MLILELLNLVEDTEKSNKEEKTPFEKAKDAAKDLDLAKKELKKNPFKRKWGKFNESEQLDEAVTAKQKAVYNAIVKVGKDILDSRTVTTSSDGPTRIQKIGKPVADFTVKSLSKWLPQLRASVLEGPTEFKTVLKKFESSDADVCEFFLDRLTKELKVKSTADLFEAKNDSIEYIELDIPKSLKSLSVDDFFKFANDWVEQQDVLTIENIIKYHDKLRIYPHFDIQQSKIDGLTDRLQASFDSAAEESDLAESVALVESRKITSKLLEMAEDGIIKWETIARVCLQFLSEDDVADMAEKNGWVDQDEDNL